MSTPSKNHPTTSLPIEPVQVIPDSEVESQDEKGKARLEQDSAPPSPLPSISKDDEIRNEGDFTPALPAEKPKSQVAI